MNNENTCSICNRNATKKLMRFTPGEHLLMAEHDHLFQVDCHSCNLHYIVTYVVVELLRNMGSDKKELVHDYIRDKSKELITGDHLILLDHKLLNSIVNEG
ncbi:MAG: hypothetical protein HPY53_00235 [Brevinematales bacterium]|nr:hypothetical protein [Brevinematales bacterium]